MPTDFEGELVVLKATTDYFFEGQLVRTDVTVGFVTLDEGTSLWYVQPTSGLVTSFGNAANITSEDTSISS